MPFSQNYSYYLLACKELYTEAGLLIYALFISMSSCNNMHLLRCRIHHCNQGRPARRAYSKIAEELTDEYSSLGLKHASSSKCGKMKLSWHPDLVHCIATSHMLRTQSISLKHGAAYCERLRLQVWRRAGRGLIQSPWQRPSPCTNLNMLVCVGYRQVGLVY